jgi:hypothetical protein
MTTRISAEIQAYKFFYPTFHLKAHGAEICLKVHGRTQSLRSLFELKVVKNPIAERYFRQTRPKEKSAAVEALPTDVTTQWRINGAWCRDFSGAISVACQRKLESVSLAILELLKNDARDNVDQQSKV